MAGMDENPYKAPEASDDSGRVPHAFFRFRTPLAGWLIIVLVLIVIVAMLLPNPRKRSRQRNAPRNRQHTSSSLPQSAFSPTKSAPTTGTLGGFLFARGGG